MDIIEKSSWAHRFRVAGKYSNCFTLTAAAFEELFEKAQPANHIKHDRTTSVIWLDVTDADTQQRFVVKRYNARNQWHKVKRAFRESRASRCWRMSQLFEQVGLSVAPPALMFEKRYAIVRQTAYFVNCYLSGDVLLDQLPSMDKTQQFEVKKALLNAFAIMREHKISHGDLKASNLIWLNKKLYFIDLDAAHQHRFNFSWRRAYKADRKRFVKNWRDQEELMQLFADIL